MAREGVRTDEDVNGIAYSPSYIEFEDGEYFSFTAHYDANSYKNNRRLSDETDYLKNLNLDITKTSYLDKITGKLVKTDVKGSVEIGHIF